METETEKEMYDRILSSITHDLKSPMTAIIWFSSFLKQRLKDTEDDEVMKIFDRILLASDQVLRMVDDILAMTKMEAGKERIEPYLVDDIEDELLKTISTFEFEARAKNIRLDLDIKRPLPSVVWDIERLRLHSFNNIISNALKFTPQGGEIALLVSAREENIEITLSDTGPGIPETELEAIFHRYEQVDLKSSRVFNGAGLGLSNAKLFIERHKGTIKAGNRKDCSGAVFSIVLPIAIG